MDSVGAYATSTAAWLSLQALPLLISPKLIVTMLSPDARRPTGPLSTTQSTNTHKPTTNPYFRPRNLPLPLPLPHPPLPSPHHDPPRRPPAPLHPRRRIRKLAYPKPILRPHSLPHDHVPHLEYDIHIYELHGNGVGVFCAGLDWEWVPELFRAVVFDVWGWGWEGKGVGVAV